MTVHYRMPRDKMVSVNEATKIFAHGIRAYVTWTPIRARILPKRTLRWYVAASRRYSGGWCNPLQRRLVAGPFETKTLTIVRCRELREGRCESHDDCRELLSLAVACFKKSNCIPEPADIAQFDDDQGYAFD